MTALQGRIEQALARLCGDEGIDLADVRKAIEVLERRNSEWDEPKQVEK